MQLAEEARVGLRRLAWMEERVRRAHDAQLEPQCCVHGLRDTLRGAVAARDDGPDAPVLVRKRSPDGR